MQNIYDELNQEGYAEAIEKYNEIYHINEDHESLRGALVFSLNSPPIYAEESHA